MFEFECELGASKSTLCRYRPTKTFSEKTLTQRTHLCGENAVLKRVGVQPRAERHEEAAARRVERRDLGAARGGRNARHAQYLVLLGVRMEHYNANTGAARDFTESVFNSDWDGKKVFFEGYFLVIQAIPGRLAKVPSQCFV